MLSSAFIQNQCDIMHASSSCGRTSLGGLLQPYSVSSLTSGSSMYNLTRNIFNTSQLAVACGGFSDVFVGDLVLPKMNDAFIAPISCKVGIKVIRAFTDSGQRDKQKAIKRLNREVCVFQRLHHANIARFLGVSEPAPTVVVELPAAVFKSSTTLERPKSVSTASCLLLTSTLFCT